MTAFTEKKFKENIRLYTDWHQFAFSIGYSYSNIEEDPHLIWLTFMFWQIDFAWKF